MDETTLRELLDHALIREPPIGPVAHNALQAGIRLRRQRRLHRIAGSMAAIAVIAAIIPIVTIGSGSAPVPAVSQSHRPTAIPPGGPRGTTMYMVSPHWLTPVATATNTPGKPIKIAGIPGPSGADLVGIAITRDGNTAFAVSSSRRATTVVPIATATNTPGKPIHVGGADDQRRLGVITDWKNGPHQLTCRQAEYTFGLVAGALAKDEPDGLSSPVLQAICDDLLEASVPEKSKDASASLAVDWTDLETFSRPPSAKGGPCADPEVSWGHRKNNLLRSQDELFYGYYLSAGTMARDENGPAVPELTRRATVSSCRHDPVRAMVPVLTAMPAAAIPLGDILDDSGYSHRDADAWALPLRAAGATARPGPPSP